LQTSKIISDQFPSASVAFGAFEKENIMKKWEYKIILVRKQQVLKENYQTLKGYQACDITYLNQLGEEGWELISCDVDHEDVGKPATMIFKRSLAS
jgi:hypothetical protein